MHWRVPPQTWGESPEERVLALETRSCIDRAIAQLPPSQREVLTLHDVEGWSSDEVCNVLKISAANQRVLLHRARTRVRKALEDYFREEMTTLDEVACQEFVELVTDYLEEVLPEPLRVRVEAHLEVCPPCRLYLGQMRLTIRALHRRENGSLSPHFRRRLLRQFHDWRGDRLDPAD
jgi:predicted DNA-binding protein (UPF0251 family)